MIIALVLRKHIASSKQKLRLIQLNRLEFFRRKDKDDKKVFFSTSRNYNKLAFPANTGRPYHQQLDMKHQRINSFSLSKLKIIKTFDLL